MVQHSNQMSLPKAVVIFLAVVLLIIGLGLMVGKAFFWDQYEKESPVSKDIEALEASVKEDPANDRALVDLGWLYFRKGDYQQAIKVLVKSNSINDKNPAAHYNLGNAYKEIGLSDKAILEFQRTIELDQDNKYAYYALGRIYFERQKWDDSIEMFKTAIEKDPVSAENFYVLAQAYEQKGFKEEARATYQKVLALVPDHALAKSAYYRLK